MSDKNSVFANLEAKMLRFYELNETIKRSEEEKELLKQSIGHIMKEHRIYEHRVQLDENYDVKATLGDRTTKKLDKEELANDLGISVEAAGKKDILIKLTEEGRLTHDRYKQYEYEETRETVSIRKVSA
jgi:hypothetical protein